MPETFSRIASRIAASSAKPEAITRALEALGDRAEQRVADIDPDRLPALAEQFVRALRNVGVSDAASLQRELFQALGVAPQSRRTVQVKDAISLVAIRNHVQQLTTAMGYTWSEGMRVQSAISDVARFVSQHGGGRIETRAEDGSLHFDVWTSRPVDGLSLQHPGQVPAWLVGAVSLSRGFSAVNVNGGTHLKLTIDRAHSAAA